MTKKLLVGTALVSCMAALGLLCGQDMKHGKHLTAVEYQELVAKDPVLQFVERVNERAVKDPIWKQNYALALYRTFGDEARAHLRELGIQSVEMDCREN